MSYRDQCTKSLLCFARAPSPTEATRALFQLRLVYDGFTFTFWVTACVCVWKLQTIRCLPPHTALALISPHPFVLIAAAPPLGRYPPLCYINLLK